MHKTRPAAPGGPGRRQQPDRRRRGPDRPARPATPAHPAHRGRTAKHGGQLRAVRQRIRAVQSIGKITRAQELIASSRIVRAQQRMREAEPYARELTRAVEAVVSRTSTIDHPLVTEPESVTRAARAGADQRLRLRRRRSTRTCCGKRPGCCARCVERNVEPVRYVAGRKGIGWHRSRGIEMAQECSGFSGPAVGRATPPRSPTACWRRSTRRPRTAGVDEIYIVCTQFVSMLTQTADGGPAAAAGDRGERRERARRGGPLPHVRVRAGRQRRAGPRCCRSTSRAGSSTPCWSRPRPSSPPGAAP